MPSQCKGCGAEMKWIAVYGKKSHPVNPKPIKVFVEMPGTNEFELKSGYESHFSTCSKADQFRSKKHE